MIIKIMVYITYFSLLVYLIFLDNIYIMFNKIIAPEPNEFIPTFNSPDGIRES